MKPIGFTRFNYLLLPFVKPHTDFYYICRRLDELISIRTYLKSVFALSFIPKSPIFI